MRIYKLAELLSKKVVHWINKRRHTRFTTCKVKVNLGCGYNITNDWINIDASLLALIPNLPNDFCSFAGFLLKHFAPETYNKFVKSLKVGRDTPDCHWLCHDISNGLPLYDNSVDYIYISHCLEHFYLKEAIYIFKECHRVLKPGGY